VNLNQVVEFEEIDVTMVSFRFRFLPLIRPTQDSYIINFFPIFFWCRGIVKFVLRAKISRVWYYGWVSFRERITASESHAISQVLVMF